ncbi:hypothetical protein N0P46_004433 [Acinetobacter baumannii]|nr:hypothetical protein [Acinetobacter baumannii]EKT9381433.1 hypothetical protein [Acinetobacter baumannii]EKU0759563.1 hypothetical protein [Acinetobacter baumannii]EKU0760091.1 hypothetical protein [Acinetobacter baumannii]EKV8394044.1 hypothetical protein [Acinetobacter baumannii]
MAKRFSPEFKQQAIDHALSNSHEPIAAIAHFPYSMLCQKCETICCVMPKVSQISVLLISMKAT